MSVIAALIEDDRTIIGSDTRAVCTSGRYLDIGEKWHEGKGGWWIGQIGDARASDVIRMNADMLTHDIRGPDDFVKRLIMAFEDEGRMRPQFHADTTVPVWCNGLILARAGKVWDLDSQLSITPILDGVFTARGCAAEIAMGAAYGARRTNPLIQPYNLDHLCIEAAAAHNVNVAGSWIRGLNPDPVDPLFPPFKVQTVKESVEEALADLGAAS